ncbi:MAG: hypothetical protein E7033_06985 [Akkermansiaceae bacterium]|nr:hypothetical protein [Akkermansiaceae bacterium]
MKIFDKEKLDYALHLLHEQLVLSEAPQTELIVCGGSALLAMRLVNRTTRDIDIVALMRGGVPVSAEPLPPYLVRAAERVADILLLPEDWLNNGPASQFTMGLPPGFTERLQRICIGEKLAVHYISREDQIYFKTFASADRGGYHISDLRALCPTDEEILRAARWCMEQDVSEGFRFIIKEMLNQSGWSDVSKQL